MNRLWNSAQPYRQLVLNRLNPPKLCSSFSTVSNIPPVCRQLRLIPSAASFTTAFVAKRTFNHAPLLAVCCVPRRLSSDFAATMNANTNVAKDVIIYKYENPRFFKYMNIFAYCQFVFWSYLAHFAYTELRDTPVDEATRSDDTISWWQKMNLGEDRYRIGMTAFSLGVGYVILSLSWLYTLRSVRFLVLRKGGQTVTMVMYGPFGRNRMMDVPLRCISAQESRQTAKVTLPVKLQGARMYYMLDMRGEFTNTQLFDATVGLKRKF